MSLCPSGLDVEMGSVHMPWMCGCGQRNIVSGLPCLACDRMPVSDVATAPRKHRFRDEGENFLDDALEGPTFHPSHSQSPPRRFSFTVSDSERSEPTKTHIDTREVEKTEEEVIVAAAVEPQTNRHSPGPERPAAEGRTSGIAGPERPAASGPAWPEFDRRATGERRLHERRAAHFKDDVDDDDDQDDDELASALNAETSPNHSAPKHARFETEADIDPPTQVWKPDFTKDSDEGHGHDRYSIGFGMDNDYDDDDHEHGVPGHFASGEFVGKEGDNELSDSTETLQSSAQNEAEEESLMEWDDSQFEDAWSTWQAQQMGTQVHGDGNENNENEVYESAQVEDQEDQDDHEDGLELGSDDVPEVQPSNDRPWWLDQGDFGGYQHQDDLGEDQVLDPDLDPDDDWRALNGSWHDSGREGEEYDVEAVAEEWTDDGRGSWESNEPWLDARSHDGSAVRFDDSIDLDEPDEYEVEDRWSSLGNPVDNLRKTSKPKKSGRGKHSSSTRQLGWAGSAIKSTRSNLVVIVIIVLIVALLATLGKDVFDRVAGAAPVPAASSTGSTTCATETAAKAGNITALQAKLLDAPKGWTTRADYAANTGPVDYSKALRREPDPATALGNLDQSRFLQGYDRLYAGPGGVEVTTALYEFAGSACAAHYVDIHATTDKTVGTFPVSGVDGATGQVIQDGDSKVWVVRAFHANTTMIVTLRGGNAAEASRAASDAVAFAKLQWAKVLAPPTS